MRILVLFHHYLFSKLKESFNGKYENQTTLRNENVKTAKDKELTDKSSNSCEYFSVKNTSQY